MRTGRFEREEASRDPRYAENVCGVLVHALENHADEVIASIDEMAGAEVHHATEDNRLIVTVEDAPGWPAKETLTALHQVPHILSVSLVYHEQCQEPDEPVEETG